MRSSNRPAIVPSGMASGMGTRWSPNEIVSGISPRGRGRGDEQRISADLAREAEQQMRMEYEQRIEEASSTAYESGRTNGEAAEAARCRNVIKAAEAAIDSIRTNEVAWQECIAENIAALAVAVARHVVGREIATDASTIADMVRRALAEFPIDQPMRVRVNPSDLSLLSLPQPSGGDPIAIAPNRDVRWLADSRIEPGGCVVEGRERIIDGRVDTALERLYRQLTDTHA